MCAYAACVWTQSTAYRFTTTITTRKQEIRYLYSNLLIIEQVEHCFVLSNIMKIIDGMTEYKLTYHWVGWKIRIKLTY